MRVGDPKARAAAAASDAAIVTKAAMRAAEALGLSDVDLGSIIGISGSTVSRMRSRERTIDPNTKEGELALTFLRLYRSLGALLGDAGSCAAWFHAENTHLGGVPAELVRSAGGLIDVSRYLDAMRGKV